MKPFLLFRAPVLTQSGYGSHSRDILRSLYEMDMFNIKIDSCRWGESPMISLDTTNPFNVWIQSNIITNNKTKPDIYIQVTVPNEFQPLGNFNIGITAGIETTVAPKNWVDGCNRMDLIITSSKFSKEILQSTVYNETNNSTGELIKLHKIHKPIKVLFEGVDTSVYNDKYKNIDLNISEDFCFLQVGNWLNGELGHDRKNIGMLIKCFVDTFKDVVDKPALILKTSSSTFSVIDRENIKNKIRAIVKGIENPPSIYLLFGELTDEEMNELYNHPKVKAMISLTKGEGFGRPLLEFSMTGKPIIASNWSGQKDFLPVDKAIMVGGVVEKVDKSVVNEYIMSESKWFTPNYDEASKDMKILMFNYDKFRNNSEMLRIENKKNFSMEKMKKNLMDIILPFGVISNVQPIILPNP